MNNTHIEKLWPVNDSQFFVKNYVNHKLIVERADSLNKLNVAPLIIWSVHGWQKPLNGPYVASRSSNS